MPKTLIKRREPPAQPPDYPGVAAFLRPLLAARGAGDGEDFSFSLHSLPSWRDLPDIEAATGLLETALRSQQCIVVVGDYDADGATSVALVYQALRSFGAERLHWYVPDRFRLGYGLSPELVDDLVELQPHIILTVDNGVAALAGAAHARAQGYKLIVTDHHLPGAELPECEALVNPNLPGCSFPGKNLAGVGVAFYLLLALRARLVANKYFLYRAEQPPNMARFLDLVALGTVADLVRLDATNRTLVEQGLRRIRAGKAGFGVRALYSVSKRVMARATSADLSFGLAPRLNAAGRIDDMSLGIKCLLAPDYKQASAAAAELDKLNAKRKRIELKMYQDAEEQITPELAQLSADERQALCLCNSSYHEGIVGIIAGRIKDKTGKACIVFAPGRDGALKGSARSVPELHIRDLLAELDARHPDLILRYGGHALAAGLSLAEANYQRFVAAFHAVAAERLRGHDPARVFVVDGELPAAALNASNAEALRYGCPWGTGFEEPLFCGDFRLVQQRLIADRHLFLSLLSGSTIVEAVLFNSGLDYYPLDNSELKLIYHLDLNLYRGAYNLRLNVRHIIKEDDDVEYA